MSARPTLIFNSDISDDQEDNLRRMAEQAISDLRDALRYGSDMRSSLFINIEDIAASVLRVCHSIKPDAHTRRL